MAKPWIVKDLDSDEKLNVCLKKILRTRFREAASYVPAAMKGEDIEDLHDVRVSIRRLESVLKIFESSFPEKLYAKEIKTIRDFLRSMGKVRELDVFLQTLNDYSARIAESERAPIDRIIQNYAPAYTKRRTKLEKTLAELSSKSFNSRFEKLIDSL